MPVKKRLLLTFSLCALTLAAALSGCASLATSTPWPTRTARPTRTGTATTVPSATVIPTATAVPVTRAGTPLPVAGLPIDVDNAARLQPVARWGQGIPQALAFSPAGNTLGLASTRGLYLYDGNSLAVVRAIETAGGYRSLAFSPDGSLVAAGSEEGKVLLWQAQDGVLAHTLVGHSGPVLALAFSPDGGLLASSGWDGAVRLWDARSAESLGALSGNLAPARRLAFSAASDRLYAWSPSDPLLVWETPGGASKKPIYVGVDGRNRSGSSAGFSADGQFFAVDQDVRARVFYTAGGNTLAQIPAPAPFLQVAVSAGGEYLAAASSDTLRIWKTQGAGLVREIPNPAGGAFTFLAFSPDGARLASAGDALRLWRLDAQENSAVATGPPAFQLGFRLSSVFTSTGEAVTLLLPDGALQSYRLADGAPLSPGRALSGTANAVALSADGALLATAGGDNRVALWRTADGQLLYAFKGHRQMSLSLAFSADGKMLASGSSDEAVFVWDTAGGTQLAALKAPGGARRVVFSPDGSTLAAGAADETLFWQVSDWSARPALPGRNPLFSPGGKLLALTGAQDGQPVVRLYAAGKGSPLQTLAVSAGALAFSPDGSLLAVSGSQNVSLWSTAGGERLADLPSPASYGQPAFSPDARLLLLSAWDGVVYVWAAP